MSMPQAIPTDFVWQSLQTGDPGPFVAFFDTLMASDLTNAAGGLLVDVGERLADESSLSDLDQPEVFARTARKALLCCMQGDEQELELLLKGDLGADD